MSQARAVLLEIIGMLCFDSAALIIEAHFSEVHAIKRASRGAVASLTIVSIASRIELG